MRRSDARGASLVGVLMIIVVLGALAATAMLGVSTLTGNDTVTDVLGTATTTTGTARTPNTGTRTTNTGSVIGATAACSASRSAAEAASTVYFVSGGSYPLTWSDLTAANPPTFVLPADVVINPTNPTQLDGRGWRLIIAGGGASAPTFTCN